MNSRCGLPFSTGNAFNDPAGNRLLTSAGFCSSHWPVKPFRSSSWTYFVQNAMASAVPYSLT